MIPKNKEILIANTHGDFSNYNCIKNDMGFYVFDFEKFSKRIVLFDNLNWYLLYIYFNFAKIFNKKTSNYLTQQLLYNLIKLVNFFIKYINKKYIKYYRIYGKNFDIYLLLYYFEKILILELDYRNISRQKNKKIAKNLIFLLKKNLEILLNKYNN